MTQTTDVPYSSARRDFTRINDVKVIEQLFDLDTLRCSLFEQRKETEQQDWGEMKQLLLNASDSKRAELLFSHRLLASYGSSMAQIRYMLDSTPPLQWQDVITDRRQELIDRMAGTEAGKHWMRCMKQEDGWKFTAIFLWSEKSKVTSEAIDLFFLMLDEISILTDLLMGRGKEYGVDFMPKEKIEYSVMRNYMYVDEDNVKEVLRLLRTSIEGKDKPKSIVMPIRAAIEAGVISRLTYEDFKKVFDPEGKVSKSTFNDYTNHNNIPYQNDPAYNALFEKFRALI